MGVKNKDKAWQWSETIPVEELFSEIRKVTGLDDLKFEHKIASDRYDCPRLEFTSQDLAEKTGFLKLMFKELYIANFNSEIYEDYDKETYEYFGTFHLWGTVSFSYTHPGGGSNGKTFMTFWYDDRQGWKFDSTPTL